MTKTERIIEGLENELIIEKIINNKLKRELSKVLDAWEYESNQGDGIMEEHSKLFSQCRNTTII